MRNIIKICLIGLILFLCKASVLGQDTNIKCEVISLDPNLSGSKALSNLGSFSVSEKGEKRAITKFYKLPRTKLILSVFLIYDVPEDKSSSDQLGMQMILGKKRFPIIPLSSLDEEKMVRDVVSAAATLYPTVAFDKGGEGVLSMPFFGKKKPVQIMITCKKLKKAGK